MKVKNYRYGPMLPLITLPVDTENSRFHLMTGYGATMATKSGSIRSLLVGTCVTSLCAGLAAVDAHADAKSQAAPPGYSLSRTGTVHDFEYFAGAWATMQHRLKTQSDGRKTWEKFPATICLEPYLGGLVTVDEMYMPTQGRAGVTVRTFDLQKRQWSIYWISSADGVLGVPGVVGGFQGNHGEFYGDDEDKGRPIRVRYTWDKLDHDHARWEQAFSYDNRTWETNWIGDFVRADPAKVCDNNRPKR